ncbi:MAG: FG-GAP repeat protein [Candidatus Lernaella stagnicola]|nr:FG-GAP repeat protein [Candidatus Lernaella stagnicola]
MRQQSIAIALTAALVLMAGAAFATVTIPASDADIGFLGEQGDNIGFITATGDFNGDGVTDLFIAAPGD